MQRQAVEVMRSEAAVSERRACGRVKVHRATCRYRRRRVEDPRLRERLRELAAARRRFGYRRLKVLLQREGFAVNLAWQRIWKTIGHEMNLQSVAFADFGAKVAVETSPK
jgi:hypothetical protein